MQLKIAVCEDEAPQQAHLQALVTAWAQKNRHLIQWQAYPGAEAFLFDWETRKDFDILLLDVDLPGMNGIELAKTIRRENAAVQIIFVTGYYDYFSDGFDVSALHYLIKPVDDRKLFPVLDRAAANLAYRERCVLLSTAEAELKIPLADIIYVEASNLHILVHTVHDTYRSRVGLARFSQLLDDSFLKVHRSFVVGLRYIKKITSREITMQSGDTVPISRGMYDAVHDALVRYL